jgi:hypothetical protein
LGGKKIDLHKLFKDVIAAGGFEQVKKKKIIYKLHIQ